MNWQIERQAAELAHAMRLLTVRFLLGEMTRVEHKEYLARLVAEYRTDCEDVALVAHA